MKIQLTGYSWIVYLIHEMSNQVVKSAIKIHNNIQVDYFAEKIKPTMVPVNSHYVNRHVDEMIEYSGISKDDKVLEVGCGMGKFTLPMLKRGFNITGLDLNSFLLQKLLEYNNNLYNVDLICSDILDIPDEYNGSYDYVIGYFTLHHFHHLETYYQAMARVLKPGGQIIFIEPNAFNILYYLQIFFSPTMSWRGDKGVAQMRRKNFKKAEHWAKLKNLKIDRYGFFPPFVVNNRWGRMLERILEKIKILNPFSAFLLVTLEKDK